MSILGRLWRLVDEMHSLPSKGSKRIERCATDAAKEIERLRRENAALCNKLAALENQTQWECSCGGTACEGQKENAALREMLARAEVLAEYTHFDGRREWRVIECWMYPNDIIVQMDRAAFNAARKEAKP